MSAEAEAARVLAGISADISGERPFGMVAMSVRRVRIILAGFAALKAERDAEQERAEKARAGALEDWHEDDGFVVWWSWRDGAWLGEPAYIGSPLCDDWPGHHTHWTPHPAFPEPIRSLSPSGETDNAD